MTITAGRLFEKKTGKGKVR